MILLDQIIRYISKDIMLPTRCYATKKQFVCIKDCCECKIFCKKPPKGSIPASVRINNKTINNSQLRRDECHSLPYQFVQGQ